MFQDRIWNTLEHEWMFWGSLFPCDCPVILKFLPNRQTLHSWSDADSRGWERRGGGCKESHRESFSDHWVRDTRLLAMEEIKACTLRRKVHVLSWWEGTGSSLLEPSVQQEVCYLSKAWWLGASFPIQSLEGTRHFPNHNAFQHCLCMDGKV